MSAESFTPKQQAIWALERKPPRPNSKVPTFELEFQLTQELLAKEYHHSHEFRNATASERDRLLKENAELYIEVAERLDYSIIMIVHAPDDEALGQTIRHIRDMVGDRYLLIAHGDATFAIPSGSDMEEVAAAYFEKPDEMHTIAARNVQWALQRGKRLREDYGIDGFALCADYAFNDGPFLSPRMFRQFVTPYLKELVAGYKQMGLYVIKHTDGNIMPILDQILEAEPHGLHSIDTQARDMDLATIKQLVGNKLCLLGGVQCSLLQTGTDEQVIENCKRALRHGMPGGGYVYCTTNVAFKGLLLERYLLMLEMRKRYGWYDAYGNPCPELYRDG